jgi:hypothetical protein
LPEGHIDKVVAKEPVYLDDKRRPLKNFKEGAWYSNPLLHRSLSTGAKVCFVRVKHCKRHLSGHNAYYHSFEFDKMADKDWNIEDTSTCQSNTDYEQEMTEVQPVIKSERYIKTMQFFEQLREPERSEAIANYDESYSNQIPKSLVEALEEGFEWEKSSQGLSYWEEEIYHPIDYGSYFKKPELLVFGKYKVGDIVVHLTALRGYVKKGSIFKVLEKSTPNILYYMESQGNISPRDWRLATPEEVEAYNQGVRNISDIKPKSMKRAIKFNSEEERRHILAYFNPIELTLEDVSSGWLCLDNGFWCGNLELLKSSDYTELSFEDWCEEFNHPFKVEKEAVHCTTQEEWDYVLSKFNPMNLKGSSFGNYYTTIYLKGDESSIGSQCNREFFEKGEFNILTFQQWCDKYGHEGLKPYVAKVGDWVYVLDGWSSCLHEGDIVQCDEISSMSGNAHFKTHRYRTGGSNSYLRDKSYRKATQAEIDSVTKTTEGLGLPTVTDTPKGEYSFAVGPVWTADNWYVEVSSQEEANEVIRAAAKMYNQEARTNFGFYGEWKFIGLCNKNNYYSLLSPTYLRSYAKPRPISDFIPVKQNTHMSDVLREGIHNAWAQKQAEAVMAGEYVHKMQELTIQCAQNLDKLHTQTQQDELVIYKPKQTRLVEPGAISANATTTNLIIKSNSKYL